MIAALVAILVAAGGAWFLFREFGGGSTAAPGAPAGGAPDASSSGSSDLGPSDQQSGFVSQGPAPPGLGVIQFVKDILGTSSSASSGPGPANIEQWRPLAEKYAQIYSILQPEEILAIIWNESSGDPEARNSAPSSSGDSIGLMQVTLAIGQAFGGVTTLEQLYDPDTNVKAGAGFLAQLKTDDADQFPITDPNFAWVAGYNEGEPNLRKHRADSSYISKFLTHLAALGGTPE